MLEVNLESMTVSNDSEMLALDVNKSVISVKHAQMLLRRIQVTKEQPLKILQSLELIKPLNVEVWDLSPFLFTFSSSLIFSFSSFVTLVFAFFYNCAHSFFYEFL
jgi:hypothetical protein